MRRGHRSAHPWVVIVSAILAACALAFGWMTRSRRPVPEPLATADWADDRDAHPDARQGIPS